MLVQFLRDVVIVVALLTALIALAFRPGKESEAALRVAPAGLEQSPAPIPAAAESVAMQPSMATPPAQQ